MQLANPSVFASRQLEMEQLANATRPYLRWRVELIPHPNGFRVKPVPVCFNRISEWIGAFGRRPSDEEVYGMDLPDWLMMVGFDGSLRLAPHIVEAPLRKVWVKFNPREVKRVGRSTVTVWANRVGSDPDASRAFRDPYPRVSECPEAAP